MATSENYILQNPSQGSVHDLTIPTDSIVYVGYRQDAFPGVIFPIPTLIWNDFDHEHKGQDWENVDVYMNDAGMQMVYFCGKLKTDNTTNLVAFRLYTGYVPYTASITISANGYSRNAGGTVTRKVYERENGETYMVDTCPSQTGTSSLSCPTTIGSTGDIIDRKLGINNNQVWRDSNGTIIGGSECQFYYRNVTQRINGRTRQVAEFRPIPNSQFGQCPTDGTQVGEETTVEVTDGLWGYATPITFTLNLNVVEKSYSYIYF